MPVFGHEYVRGLDIPVDDALGVCGVEPLGDLDSPVQHPLHRQRFTLNAVLSERFCNSLGGGGFSRHVQAQQDGL